ncbi:hypothetical protein ADH76_11350 [Enterocloster clostridioformis]|uniref:hypothetical protein n=1 Tax=Enterocloster clostridioformis TaxID=1531 RepID=UPI00080C502A|nr:hypothetical protein [Enterocloster clostridioformis]ANU48291.1 hypothetical protein A4V08_23260 [Lachnoclostridium sp. YL32]NDO29465.1 hypothetical protein [Enterocloster clostridioformis]OXE69004.1 hypothetical protein ADH76_11350 [Enterocloster clostridioformis]QQR02821.1 hypothetical protein I5Q83_11550 [Enterocloster clostridioformis]
MGKKDEYRFTIRFDPDDDRHRLVAQILNSQGRKIARYVARAVLACHEEEAVSGYEELPSNNKRGKPAESGIKEDASSLSVYDVEERYEMDEEEIALLKSTNHMFRRK